ncbi:MAG TPA: hypothetical protein VGN42_20685 [Pirellulales bacterium]|jgi:hypothetical protein|nr:hypothetical protein [Pirellulales bacterium]
MYERRRQALLTRRAFVKRLGRSFAVSLLIVVFSLSMGSGGYHFFGRLAWIDALLNASMILTGMGPVDPMTSTAGKLFASFYALYSGIAFLTMMAVLLAPVIHRFLHKFHLAESDDGGKPEKPVK